MTITFITGANKGLGHETARRLIARGHTVLLGARDPEAGAAAAGELGARFVRIDVTDDASVAAAAADVDRHEGSVDVLINNAGVHGPHGDPSDLTGADVLGVLDVNVAGVVRTSTAFLPLLRRSADPVIINVSSSMGSLAATHDPARAESKAIAPVYTATDLNGRTGPQTVTEGTDAVVGLATEGPGHGSGRFVDRDGEITWS